MFSWIKDLSSKERRTLWACFGGWTLDAMDLQVYAFVIPTLISIWHLTNAQAGEIGTTIRLTSSLGGWMIGILCDRYGRVRMLQISILWYAVFCGLSGFAQSGEQLMVIRGLQGLGFGGEWACGSVLMGEIIQAKHRGKAVGYVQTGFPVGWAIAALAATVSFSYLPQDTAWRVLFFIGVLPAFLVFYIRRNVPEPEIFERTKKMQGSLGANIVAIFSPSILRITILTSLLGLGMQGSAGAITTWLPTYLKTVRGLSILNTGGYLSVIIFGAFCGYLINAHLSDGIGRRKTFLIYAVCCWVTVVSYTFLPLGNTGLLIMGFPLGFFTQGIYGTIGSYYTELFPTKVRAAGQGFSYNVGHAIGSLFTAIVGILSASMPLGEALGLLCAGGYGLVIVAILLLPETKGKDLEAAEKQLAQPKPIPG
jgi:MFS family permease